MSEVERELRNLQSSFRSIHIPPNAPDSSSISLSLSGFFFFGLCSIPHAVQM